MNSTRGNYKWDLVPEDNKSTCIIVFRGLGTYTEHAHIYTSFTYSLLYFILQRCLISTIGYMSIVTMAYNFSGHRKTMKTSFKICSDRKLLTIIIISFLDFILIYTFLHTH